VRSREVEDDSGDQVGIGTPSVLAQVLLEHAELLHADRRDEAGAPLLGEPIEIFTRLRATPHHDRAQALSAGGVS
jgi:hypothetical protein